MLYLIGEHEVNYIFDNEASVEEIARRALATYKKRPGFFTPYRDAYEFTGELIAPGLYPLFGLFTSGFSAFAAVFSAVVSIGSLCVAAGAVIGGASKLRHEALSFASLALQFVGIALATSAVSLLMAVISFPHSIASVMTRTAVTLGSLASCAQMDTDMEPSTNTSRV